VSDAPLILTVQKSGKFYLGRKEVPEAELVAKLEALFEARSSKEIYLRADKEAAYGVVVKAMAAVREAGSTKLGIVTETER
jgi:biopolymer transport protein TolR